MKAKRIAALLSLAVILAFGVYAAVYTYNSVPITYDGSDTDVAALYANPDNYDLSDPDGVADIIVKTDLQKTMAVNDVASVVFDYRGYDTLGESFILLTAIAGSFVILSRSGKKSSKKEEQDQ